MALIKIMHIRVMFMIVYCYTFLVGTNAPVSNRETYQCCCRVYSGKGSYTFRLGVLPDHHGRSEQGHCTVIGWLKYSFDGHESAAVRKPRSTLLSKVFSFSRGKHCKMCGARLDTEHVKALTVSVKFKACAQMKRNVPGTLIHGQSTCLQFCREILCLLDCFSVSDVTIKVNSTTNSSAEDSSLSNVDCTHQEECISSRCLQDEVTFSIHRIVDNSTVGLCIADCEGFLYFPGLLRLLLHSFMFDQSLFTQWLHFSINAVLCFIYNVIYVLFVTLAMLYKYTKEDITKNNKSTNITTVFVTRHWNGKRWTEKCFGLGIARNQTVYCGFKQLHVKLLQDENSKLSILNEYTFLPWCSKFEEENSESKFSFYHSRLGDCHFLNDTHFSKCHPYISSFHFPDSLTIHVNPVTRFLPDPTFTPDVDMSHVGYRLATLGALPSSVPVSRVRLAEAGFYFQGHNEEVTCYSCQVRYSDWSRSDNPMDIHRELSPHCEHVLARDRELAVLASGNNPSDAHRESSQRSVLSSSPEDSHARDSHAEDGEHSEAQTPNESPVQNSIVTQSTNASRNEARNLQGPVTGLANLSPTTGAVRTISNGSPPVLTTASANANTVARSVTNVQSTTDLTASSGSGVIRSSSGGSSPHLYPRARLDVGGAVYPMYHTMASRRRSFTSAWDETRAPPLDEVILCGMFYAGYADCVRCFFCGVGLKNWVVTDNVWIEHVRWRASCGYLRAVKGDDFVRAMQRRLGTSNPTGDAAESGSHGLAQAQGIDSESPQRSTALSVISTQTQPTPATVRISSSGGTSGTDATSTAPTSITSSATASHGTPRTSGEEAARTSRTSRPDPAAAPSSSAGSGGHGAEGQRRCGGERRLVGREERRRGGASVSEVPGNESAEEDRLQVENRQLSELFRCRVCHLSAIDTILMPCGHLVICSACAASVTSCPLCQQLIQATARVYLGN